MINLHLCHILLVLCLSINLSLKMVSHIKAAKCSQLFVNEKQKEKITVIENPGPILIQNKVNKSKTPCITVLLQNCEELTIFSKDVKKLFYGMNEGMESDRRGVLLITTVNGKKDFLFFLNEFHLHAFSELSPINLYAGPRHHLHYFDEKINDINRIITAVYGKEDHYPSDIYAAFNVFAIMYISFVQENPKATKEGLRQILRTDSNEVLEKMSNRTSWTLKEIKEYCEKRFRCQSCNNFTIKKCSNCRMIYYCNPTCQTSHWPDHMKLCVEWKEYHAQRVQFAKSVEKFLEDKLKIDLSLSFSKFNARMCKHMCKHYRVQKAKVETGSISAKKVSLVNLPNIMM